MTEEIRTDNKETLKNALKRIAELEKENAELKADNDARKFAMAMSEKVEKQLREENAELKEKLKPENCLKLLAKDGYIKFTSEQLTKAKEIIKEYIRINLLSLNERNFDDEVKLFIQAEDFIKE